MSDPPSISILLLGDANVGKSTFLARLAHGPSGGESTPISTNRTEPVILELRRPLCRLECSTLSTWPTVPLKEGTVSPYTGDEKTTLTGQRAPQPAVIILCYSVSSRQSLLHVRDRWSKLVGRELNWDEGAPIMLLGLRRDLRGQLQMQGRGRVQKLGGGKDDTVGSGEQDEEEEEEDSWVIPEAGLAVAQDLRCDRYAECSAVTGELMREVWEDLVQMAVGRMKEWGGGRSEGPWCCAM